MASLLNINIGLILRGSATVKAGNAVNFLTLSRAVANSSVKMGDNLPEQQQTSTDNKRSKPYENGKRKEYSS